MTYSESSLTYQVYVAPIIAMAGKDVPPGQSRSTWSPISATLIRRWTPSVRLMTVEQGMAEADWVSTTGKNLTTVYVTHGPVPLVRARRWSASASPASRAVATAVHRVPGASGPTPEVLQTFWQPGSRARSLMTTPSPIRWTVRCLD